MGYSANYFGAHVHSWIDRGWLPKNGNIIEFGAQLVEGEPVEVKSKLGEFLRAFGSPDNEVAPFLDTLTVPFPSRLIYEFIGINYVAFDVNGQFDSVFFDLNCQRVPERFKGSFHVVNNEGTLEHCALPLNGLNAAHDLARVGGVIRHSMPLSGWFHHGIMYPTPKFWQLMAGANDYEVLYQRLEGTSLKHWRGGVPGFDTTWRIAELSSGNDRDLWEIELWFHGAYRKTSNAEFVTPVDHLEFDKQGAVQRVLEDNYRRLERGLLDAGELD